jgi:hypothetical protein
VRRTTLYNNEQGYDMAASKVEEVEEVMDITMDDADYADEDDYADEVENAIGDMPQAEPGSKTTSTANFMNDNPEIVDEIEDLGIVVVDPEADGYIVRVVSDIGPVYYGDELIELKKGRKYRVPPHIYAYLSKRDLLWEQQ